MPAIHKKEGHDAEEHELLHDWIKNFTGATDVDVEGSTQTKTDIITNTGVRFSHKYPSPRNTQVHLPTLASFHAKFNLPKDVYKNLEMFLGTFDTEVFNSWVKELNCKPSANEIRKQRIHSNHLPTFQVVLDYFNKITKDKSLLKYLLQQLREEDPVEYLIWTSKTKGWSQMIKLDDYIDWLAEVSVWEASKNGTTIFVKDPTWEGKRTRRLLYMQMKGSGKGDYHAPMFHLYCNWPERFIIQEKKEFWLK